MKTNQAYSFSLPSYKSGEEFHNRNLMFINPYRDGLWTGSKRYAL